MDRELTLICQGCRNRVSDDAGYLWAHTRDVHTVQREAREWGERHGSGSEDRLTDLHDFLDYPEQASWRAHHGRCDPDRDGGHYRIAVDQLRTRADLLGWTAHLMGKGWLCHTDWPDLLREARRGGKRLIVVSR
uniref:hypothetical protein n=1 Tax=Streptomyces achromogenes TaxID=67255 RepID=UPI003F497C95